MARTSVPPVCPKHIAYDVMLRALRRGRPPMSDVRAYARPITPSCVVEDQRATGGGELKGIPNSKDRFSLNHKTEAVQGVELARPRGACAE